MDPKLLHNSNISLIVVLIPEVISLSPMNTSSVSVTVTCLLIRVTILQRVSTNSISHSYLKFVIVSEYKPGVSVISNGITMKNIFGCLVRRRLFFSIYMANWNLVVYLSCIQADGSNFILYINDGAYSIVTIYNRELKRFGNTVEFSMRDTHSPN